jgi:hypothetical protein
LFYPQAERRRPRRDPLNLIRVMPAKEKRGEMKKLTTISDPVEGLQPLEELPASERVYKTDGDIRVPMRRIQVGGGEPPVDV